MDLSTVWQACPQFFLTFSKNNMLYYSIIHDLSNLSILSIGKYVAFGAQKVRPNFLGLDFSWLCWLGLIDVNLKIEGN